MEEILEQPQLDSTEQGTAVQTDEGSLNEQKTGMLFLPIKIRIGKKGLMNLYLTTLLLKNTHNKFPR